jgi:hypothetical protein
MVDYHDPKVWGPKFWAVYDIIGETYPRHPVEKDKVAVKMFFSSQKRVIPCKTCRKSYKKIYRDHPPQVDSREELQAWIKLLKEKVAQHTAAGVAAKK